MNQKTVYNLYLKKKGKKFAINLDGAMVNGTGAADGDVVIEPTLNSFFAWETFVQIKVLKQTNISMVYTIPITIPT